MPDIVSTILLVLIAIVIIGPRRLPEALEALWFAITDYRRGQRNEPLLGNIRNARVYWTTHKDPVFAAVQFLYVITEHLEDLRKRLIVSLAALGLTFGLALFFAQNLLGWLIQPINIFPLSPSETAITNYVLANDVDITTVVMTPSGPITETIRLPSGIMIPLTVPQPKPVFLRPTELFSQYIRIGFVAGLGIALPILVWQLLLFLRGDKTEAAKMSEADFQAELARRTPEARAELERQQRVLRMTEADFQAELARRTPEAREGFIRDRQTVRLTEMEYQAELAKRTAESREELVHDRETPRLSEEEYQAELLRRSIDARERLMREQRIARMSEDEFQAELEKADETLREQLLQDRQVTILAEADYQAALAKSTPQARDEFIRQQTVARMSEQEYEAELEKRNPGARDEFIRRQTVARMSEDEYQAELGRRTPEGREQLLNDRKAKRLSDEQLTAELARRTPQAREQLIGDRKAVYDGLTAAEVRPMYFLVPLAGVFFVLGLVFTYYVLLPNALNFLFGLGGGLVQAMPALEEYIGFVLTLMIWVGVSFETPLIMFFLSRFHLVQAGFWARQWRYAVVIITVVAAVITPTTDPFNMALVAGPMFLLYGLGIIFARFA